MVHGVLKSAVRFLARLRHYARLFGYARMLCVLLLIALLGVRVADPFPLEELRVRTFDGYQILQPRKTTQRPVVIVDLDEKSLAKF
ncbi:MAG: adenylate/guanylate cyclase domain-containing protein, partial [Afipia sp.]|nr:adenylate/guanylate cyclase domain-containing protein [Afipia sp.]